MILIIKCSECKKELGQYVGESFTLKYTYQSKEPVIVCSECAKK